MTILTPEELVTLEMLVGVRAPVRTTQEILHSLVENGWASVDRFGQVIPTDAGVRVTAPQHMNPLRILASR